MITIFTGIFLFMSSLNPHGNMEDQLERKMTYGKAQPITHLIRNYTVTLNLLQERGHYTAEEAKPILDSFFNEYPPESCPIQDNGTYNNQKEWFEGTYKTEAGNTFDAYFEATFHPDEGHHHLSLIRVKK